MQNDLLVKPPETAVMIPADLETQLSEGYDEALTTGGIEFPRVKIAHQNGIFEMPVGDPVRTFRGLYIGEAMFRVYYSKKGADATEKVPPDCSSPDGKTGTHDPETMDIEGHKWSIYGKCAQCWFNQFGSAPEGNGKACSTKVAMMVWPTGVGAALPYVLTLSVKSLDNIHGHVQSRVLSTLKAQIAQIPKSSSKKMGTWAYLVEFSLDKKEKGAFKWSELNGTILGSVRDGKVSVADARMAYDIYKQWLPYLTNVPVVDESEDDNGDVTVVVDKPEDSADAPLPF